MQDRMELEVGGKKIWTSLEEWNRVSQWYEDIRIGKVNPIIEMKLKQTSKEGYTSYLVYSTDTQYKEQRNRERRVNSNYYSNIRFRNKETEEFDQQYYNSVHRISQGKVRGVW